MIMQSSSSELMNTEVLQFDTPQVMPMPSQHVLTNIPPFNVPHDTNAISASSAKSSESQTCVSTPSPKRSTAATSLISKGFLVSPLHKYTLLFLFCLSQVLDTLNNGALWAAIPTLSRLLGMSQAQSTWLITTYQLTFASFLLIVSI